MVDVKLPLLRDIWVRSVLPVPSSKLNPYSLVVYMRLGDGLCLLIPSRDYRITNGATIAHIFVCFAYTGSDYASDCHHIPRRRGHSTRWFYESSVGEGWAPACFSHSLTHLSGFPCCRSKSLHFASLPTTTTEVSREINGAVFQHSSHELLPGCSYWYEFKIVVDLLIKHNSTRDLQTSI